MATSLCCGLHTTPPGSPQLHQWKLSKKGRCPSLNRVKSATVTSKLELSPLPYLMNSLEPYMSSETLEQHWGRHQRAHVESLNEQIEGTGFEEMSLEDIVVASYNKGDPHPSFKHAAQIWNHDFFWNSMKPGGGGKPSGVLLELIERDFGSFEGMLRELKRAASTQFGSGWAWLVYKANRLDVENAVNPCPTEEDNKLVVAKSPNAVNPLVWDYSPLLGIDVWEHAYYLDYENRRADYVSVFLEKLVSWEVVSSRLEMAMAQASGRGKQGDGNEEDEMSDGEAVEMYLDSESDDSDAE
ncbi:superoxide dismutase [Fe], chloroplastic isoform X2 [Asparagus officinalis]|uniref:superoxide dismutase [Fe], chloroplastic isoform X2 n=1 Tax=Asparagus officinalis TaxID=4686 RepID=UPI00098E0745|nr:superoxide dismutase [Fe], chloroplastic isoform X2 [Asparagus officinalis]